MLLNSFFQLKIFGEVQIHPFWKPIKRRLDCVLGIGTYPYPVACPGISPLSQSWISCWGCCQDKHNHLCRHQAASLLLCCFKKISEGAEKKVMRDFTIHISTTQKKRIGEAEAEKRISAAVRYLGNLYKEAWHTYQRRLIQNVLTRGASSRMNGLYTLFNVWYGTKTNFRKTDAAEARACLNNPRSPSDYIYYST